MISLHVTVNLVPLLRNNTREHEVEMHKILTVINKYQHQFWSFVYPFRHSYVKMSFGRLIGQHIG